MYGNNGVHTFLLNGKEVTSEVTPLKEISTQVRKQNGEEFPPNSLLHLAWLAYNDTSGLKGDRPLTF